MNKNDERDGHLENQSNNSNRRGFLKKGVIVTAPVILSAWSRPVLAATVSLSGILSGNASGEGFREGALGKSPGYWKHERNLEDVVDVNTPYHPFFEGSYIPIDPVTNVSMSLLSVMDVYNSNGLDKYSPAFHLIAAYANSLYFSNYLLSTTDVLDLATQYALDPSHANSDRLRTLLDTTWK